MADLTDKTLPELTAVVTPAVDDLTYLVDVSDTTDSAGGSSKKSTIQQLADLLASLVQTLTNKTFTAPVINGAVTGDAIATGATIDTGTANDDIVTSKAIADSKLSYTDGVETLSNKTETAPVINAPVINGAVTGDAIATGATIDAGTANDDIVTSKAIMDSKLMDGVGLLNYSGSITSSPPTAGSTQFYVQCGTFTGSFPDGSYALGHTFPTAFPNGIITVVWNFGVNSTIFTETRLASASKTGFSINNGLVGSGPYVVNYIAIGW